MIYYPLPLHKQKAYIDDRYPEGHFPITEKLCDSVLSLPMHTELTVQQLEYIGSHVLSFVKKQKV
jgi:dTDP-4-amino-4,6-dideoxygalactose transaminase